MRKLAVCFALLVMIPALAASTRAQEAPKPDAPKPAASVNHSDTAQPPAHFYRLDFVLEDLDSAGKPINSRSFSTTASTAGSRSDTLRVGTKVPIVTGGDTPKANPNENSTQFQYADVGVEITASDIQQDGSHLAFYLHAEVSSLATPSMLNGVSEPVFRQNVWTGAVLIPIGKATAVFKSDSLEDKGAMQLEMTATPME